MTDLTRRETLLLSAGAAATFLPFRRATTRSVEDLARAFRSVPRNEVFKIASDAIRKGTQLETFFAAIFRAGVMEIRPRPHGILHCVMEVESNCLLANATSGPEAWLPALWNLDDFKVSQARDVEENQDWTLSVPPDVRFPTENEAHREFVAAMNDWDADRAERALVGLIRFHELDSILEILWPLGMRCSAFIGHKAIYTVQIARTLRRIGWVEAQPALRSLVRALLVGRETEDFTRAQALQGRMAPKSTTRTRSAKESWALLNRLREATPRAAQELIVGELVDGFHPDTAWDAIRLLGSELFLRRPGKSAASGREALLPVHGVTVPSALGYIYRTSKSEATRRIAILQAAAWTTGIRDRLRQMIDLDMEGPGIDRALATVEAPMSLHELLEDPNPRAAWSLLDAKPMVVPAFSAALRESLYRHGLEHHQHKYAAAVIEEARLAHPDLRATILGASVDYLITPNGRSTDTYLKSIKCLEEAGVM